VVTVGFRFDVGASSGMVLL